MYFLFFSLLSLVFKWQRLIFVLIALEYLVLTLFLFYSSVLSSFYFFFFLSFTVISSVLGMLMMVGSLKFFGQDKSIFYEFKLIKLLVFKTKNFVHSDFIMISIFLFRGKGMNLKILILD